MGSPSDSCSFVSRPRIECPPLWGRFPIVPGTLCYPAAPSPFPRWQPRCHLGVCRKCPVWKKPHRSPNQLCLAGAPGNCAHDIRILCISHP